jgi:hypothetical protein
VARPLQGSQRHKLRDTKKMLYYSVFVFRLMVAIFGPIKNQGFEQIMRDVPIAN